MIDFKNPPVLLTAQEVYEYQRAFFIEQGRLSYGDDGSGNENSCMYRSPEGLKCAAGCLIPDSIYEEPMSLRWETEEYAPTVGKVIEGKFVDQILDAHPALEKRLNGQTPDGQRKLKFIEGTQQIHDDTARTYGSDESGVKRFIERLDEFAEKFGLEVVKS